MNAYLLAVGVVWILAASVIGVITGRHPQPLTGWERLAAYVRRAITAITTALAAASKRVGR